MNEPNKFLIYFKRSTNGFQVFCSIERKPVFDWPHVGILHDGKEMTPEACLKYAAKYIAYRKAQEPEFVFEIDESGLKF